MENLLSPSQGSYPEADKVADKFDMDKKTGNEREAHQAGGETARSVCTSAVSSSRCFLQVPWTATSAPRMGNLPLTVLPTPEVNVKNWEE
jgi:hypothetical protein